jgi:dTDP-4-amino-4,6-dideoxygalactose transaminase
MDVFEKRIVPFQKRRLDKKLRGFDKLVAHQQWVVTQYEDRLAQAKLEPVRLDDHLEPVLYKYPLLFDQQSNILAQARQARIEVSNLFASPLNLQRPRLTRLWRAFGYRKGMCPIAEGISDRIIALPIHSRVQAGDIERTVAFLASFR